MTLLTVVLIEQIGIDAKHVRLPTSATQDEVNNDANDDVQPWQLGSADL